MLISICEIQIVNTILKFSSFVKKKGVFTTVEGDLWLALEVLVNLSDPIRRHLSWSVTNISYCVEKNTVMNIIFTLIYMSWKRLWCSVYIKLLKINIVSEKYMNIFHFFSFTLIYRHLSKQQYLSRCQIKWRCLYSLRFTYLIFLQLFLYQDVNEVRCDEPQNRSGFSPRLFFSCLLFMSVQRYIYMSAVLRFMLAHGVAASSDTTETCIKRPLNCAVSHDRSGFVYNRDIEHDFVKTISGEWQGFCVCLFLRSHCTRDDRNKKTAKLATNCSLCR